MATGNQTRRLRGDAGTAAVEFALLLPVLATLVLGVLSTGVVLSQKQQMAYAVREGARHGAVLPAEQVFNSGTWASNVRSWVVSKSTGTLVASQVCVALVRGVTPVPFSTKHTTKADGSACYNDSSVGDSSDRVQVLATRPAKIEAALFTQAITLKEKATSRFETYE